MVGLFLVNPLVVAVADQPSANSGWYCNRTKGGMVRVRSRFRWFELGERFSGVDGRMADPCGCWQHRSARSPSLCFADLFSFPDLFFRFQVRASAFGFVFVFVSLRLCLRRSGSTATGPHGRSVLRSFEITDEIRTPAFSQVLNLAGGTTAQ